MVQGVQISRSDQARALQVRTSKRISRPELRQIVVADQKTGDHVGLEQKRTENGQRFEQSTSETETNKHKPEHPSPNPETSTGTSEIEPPLCFGLVKL